MVEDGKDILINGLSDECAVQITRKAIDLLSPPPTVKYDYVVHQGKRLFVMDVEKSDAPVLLGGKIYSRTGDRTTLRQAGSDKPIRNTGIARLSSKIFKESRQSCTAAKAKLLDHYESVLRILDDLGNLLYPQASNIPTDNAEGKMLMRILFSSCADTFEIFMSDLLYEIYLAKRETLKSDATVKVKDVLDCSDMQEFINRYAKEKRGLCFARAAPCSRRQPSHSPSSAPGLRLALTGSSPTEAQPRPAFCAGAMLRNAFL